MIDSSVEQVLPLSDLAREVPRSGKKGVNVATVWRWTIRPNRYGVKLESLIVGGQRMSSREALHRFFAATTAAADGEPIPVRTSRQRERQIEQAERELAST